LTQNLINFAVDNGTSIKETQWACLAKSAD
jgi:hypothetical protein